MARASAYHGRSSREELKRAWPPRHVKKLRLLFYSMRAHRLDAGVPWSDINSKIFLCEIAK